MGQARQADAERVLGKEILAVVGEHAALLSLRRSAVLVPRALELNRSESEHGRTERELVRSLRCALVVPIGKER